MFYKQVKMPFSYQTKCESNTLKNQMFHFALFKVKTTRLLKTNNEILKVSVIF